MTDEDSFTGKLSPGSRPASKDFWHDEEEGKEVAGKALEVDKADFTHTGMAPSSPTSPGPSLLAEGWQGVALINPVTSEEKETLTELIRTGIGVSGKRYWEARLIATIDAREAEISDLRSSLDEGIVT